VVGGFWRFGGGKKDFLTPGEIKDIIDYIRKFRSVKTPFDVCLSVSSAGKDLSKEKAIAEPYKRAGVTWWIDFIYSGTGSLKKNKERILAGPPR